MNECSVLFVRPPEGGSYRSDYSQVEPMGIAHLCAVLHRNGIKAEYLDLEFFPEDIERFGGILETHTPPIVAFSLSYPQATVTLNELLYKVRETCPDSTTIAGGQYVSLVGDRILTDFPILDVGFRYEAEPYIQVMVESILEGRSLEHVPNVIRRSEGEIINNGVGERVEDLDLLPFAYRDPRVANVMRARRLSAGIVGSRGCWYGRCKYCVINQTSIDKRWIPRSVESIADEIVELIDNHGFTSYTIVDAEFLGPVNIAKNRSIAFSAALKNRDINVPFSVNLRPENIQKQALLPLIDVGLSMVFLGLESASCAHLRRWDRTMDENVIIRAVELLEELGLPFTAGFIMFDPLSTLDDMRKNLEFLVKYPVIDPGLIVRGLELREGMPLYNEIGKKLPSDSSRYFVHDEMEGLIEMLRSVFAKPLYLLHILSSSSESDKINSHAVSQLRRSACKFFSEKSLELIRNYTDSRFSFDRKQSIFNSVQQEFAHLIGDLQGVCKFGGE